MGALPGLGPALCLALALALGAGAAAGQDLVAPQPGEKMIIRAQGSQFAFVDEDTEPERLAWVFLGGVEVDYGPRKLLGRTLVLLVRPDSTEEAEPRRPEDPLAIPSDRVLGAYLEGDISVEEGDELVVGAGAVHLDNTTGRLTIVDGHWLTAIPGSSLVVRFELMRELVDGSREMEGITWTTCDYAHAHWGVSTAWARLAQTQDGRVLSTAGNVPEVGGVPVFWLPGLNVNVDKARPPLRRLGVGNSNRYGTELRSLWGADADGFLTQGARLFGYEGRVRGNWEVELNNFSKRGLFVQPGIGYKTKDSFGELFGAWIHDHADRDQLGQPIDDKSRGRIYMRHRTRIDDHQVVDAELSYISDANFLEEYYPQEFRTGKEQETYVNYRNVNENDAWSILVRARLNNFQTQTEYLPEIRHRRVGETVDALGGAVFTGSEFADYVELEFAEQSTDPLADGPRVDNIRVGADGQFVWPFDVAGDRVTAKVAYDLTYFNKTRDRDTGEEDGATFRRGVEVGASWSQTWSGVDQTVQSQVFNFQGVRQIVEPMVEYTRTLTLNKVRKDLYQFDEVDQLRKEDRIDVGLRHRVQTHQRGEVVTVFDTVATMPVFRDANRDNGGDSMGNIDINAVWTPGANIFGLQRSTIRWASQIDPNHWSSVDSYLSYTAPIGENRSWSISHNSARGVFETLTVGAEWVLTPIWTAAVFAREDLRLDQREDRGLMLRQRAHNWIIDYQLTFNRGENRNNGNSRDDTAVRINFRPVAAQDASETLLSDLGRIR